ncbi:MAG: hypothetical protein NUV90_01030 [Candidatus Parcubacteria bacterium]|nr:hypothetical protein [Candidatus Parcubacteria bacterium]
MARRLQDREQIPVANIPPDSWYMILEDIVSQSDGVLGRAQTVFVPIADLMSGHDECRIQIQVPRGRTLFEKGLSPITRVLPIRVEEKGTGTRLSKGIPGLWSKNYHRYLFLLAPEQGKPLVWATWCVDFSLAIVEQADKNKSPYIRTVSSSRVDFLDKEVVLEEFRQRSGLGYIILDHIYLGLHGYETELQKVTVLCNTVEQMKYRIKL